MRIKKITPIWIVVLIILSNVLLQRCSTNTRQKNNQKDADTTIRLKAIHGLRYDIVRFSVEPGARVKLTLVNNDDMDHNLVFTKPGVRKEILKSALQLGAKGPEVHYIPTSPNTLWYISSVSPGDSQTITFTAPDKKGIYPYVCTYPGHGATMYGAMYVSNKKLPPLKDDPNIPSDKIKEADSHNHTTGKKQLHPYKIVAPYLIRTFMPNCGPAAIAVTLPDSLSYCWDAGACRMRYAWSGEFLDSADLWQRKGNEVARITGTLFFKDKTNYPFRVGNKDSIPQLQFKGYRFINNYPEFHYQWNGTDVYEMIKQKPDGEGLVRSFRIPDASIPIWFLKDYSGTASISSSAGQWNNNWLKLSPAEAKHFTITITKKKEN